MNIVYLLLFIFSAATYCQERITSFTSTLILKSDGNLVIKEEIEVVSTLHTIRHGIIREIPTCYRDKWGIQYNSDFTILGITCDERLVPFKVESVSNGKIIYIGDKNTLVIPGTHRYVIMYEINRHIGFFDDHDEIYWNVTGNDWDFIIDRAQAYVYLPKKVAPEVLKAEAYTGYYGVQSTDYSAFITNDHIFFKTTSRLYRSQGLTVVVSFPKGIITKPSFSQEAWWFLRDNLAALFLCICLVIIFALIIRGVMVAHKTNPSGVIIPLFYPPENMTPSAIGYLTSKRFYNTLLSADIINLAVKGFITITYDQSRWWGGKYTLRLTDTLSALKLNDQMRVYDETLLTTLFSKKEEIVIEAKSNDRILRALEKCEQHTTRRYNHHLIVLKNFLYPIYIISFVMVVVSVIADIPYFVLISLVLLGFSFFPFFKNLFLAYTPEGRKSKDSIEGFKLYLKAAEVDRMHISGTPPTKTPELYETYLPYAVALGVEEQWTRQFGSVFEVLAVQGHTYHPVWYRGRIFRPHSFGSELSRSFTTTIAAASTPPARSSGAGGRGYSGGGGGGGGGRGW